MVRPELEQLVGGNERVLWSGAPNRRAFLLRSMLNDSVNDIISGNDTFMWFTIPFFFFHMFPVWLYLGTIITSFVRLRNTGYIITDKSVYISGGVFALNSQVKPLAKLSTVTISRGLIDKWCKVGSVVLNDDTTTNSNRANFFSANSQDLQFLADYESVFALVRDTQARAFLGT